ncbi:polysaccharide biosynthesis protein [Ktedonobacteria bacterium brp13]|nr:polysaccharide biosynthesis protein [Ktedonobacteria bacterium brp13]
MPRFWRGDSSNTHDQANLNFLCMKNFRPVFRNYCSPDDITVVATQKLPVVHNIATEDPNLALMIDEQCEQELPEFTAITDDYDDYDVSNSFHTLEKGNDVAVYDGKFFSPTRDMIAIAGGAFVVGLGILAYYVLRYVTNVVMARMVAPETYGVYDEVIAVTVVCGWTAKLGLDNVLLRLVPNYRIHGQYSLIHGLFRFTLAMTLVVSTALGTALFVFAPQISLRFYHNMAYSVPLRELSVLIPLQSLQFLLAASLQAFKAIRWKMLIDRLLQPLVTFIALMIFCLFQWTMETLSAATITGFVCTVAIGWLALILVKRRMTLKAPATYQPGYWSIITLPMFLNVLLLGIIESTSMLLLGAFSSPLQVAGYQNAERVASFVSIPTTALCIAFSPRVVEYFTHRRMEELARLYKLVTRWSFAFSLPLFLWVMVFHQAILLTFGASYTNVALVMIMIALGLLVFSLLGPAGYLLTMVARPRLILINSAIISLIDFGLLWFLIRYQGALGAGYAFVLMILMMYGLNFLQVYRFLGMQPWSREMHKPVLAGAAATLIGLSLLHVIGQTPTPLLPLEQIAAMLTFFIAYSLIIFLLRFSSEGYLVLTALLHWLVRLSLRVYATGRRILRSFDC